MYGLFSNKLLMVSNDRLRILRISFSRSESRFGSFPMTSKDGSTASTHLTSNGKAPCATIGAVEASKPHAHEKLWGAIIP